VIAPAAAVPDGAIRAQRLREQLVISAVALAGAAFALCSTVGVDFLRYPGWLGVQKADIVLGPVLIGLYWRRVRPASRFGWLLIAYGLVNIGYVAQSFTNPNLFGIGLVWESLLYLGTQILILTFPTGRLDGWAAKLLAAGAVFNAVFNVWLITMLPNTGAGGSISQCRVRCPDNGLAFAPDVPRALSLFPTFELTVLAVAGATAVLMIWRFARGARPERRAFAIGMPFVLVFLACQTTYLWLTREEIGSSAVRTDLQWAFVGARAAIWYGFFFALIGARMFASGVTRKLLVRTLRRPSRSELEAMLRSAVGDPSFQLRFWDARANRWDGEIDPPSRSVVTFVERDDRPSIALVHDVQLADDPELVQAAGAIALLVAENVELDAGWTAALDDLEQSRARIVQAVDDERHRLANDLHDGVQQRLGGVRLRLRAAALKATDDSTRVRLASLDRTVEETIADVRSIAHQLHPRAVIEEGLVAAVARAIDPIALEHDGVGHHGTDRGSAVYHSVLEIVGNAQKHGGHNVTATLSEVDGFLTFAVSDDGPGFDPAAATTGIGLRNVQDRVAAFGGTVSIDSVPGRTTVTGRVPAGGE
jgi:signal transduction histidine kinase